MSVVEFRKQLEGYGLTTANILYRMPDHPSVLQTYVWQAYDLAPRFPATPQVPGFLVARTRRTAAFGAGRAQAPDQRARSAHGDDGTPPALIA